MLAQVSFQYDWNIVWDNLGPLWRGLLVTIQIAALGMALALVLDRVERFEYFARR